MLSRNRRVTTAMFSEVGAQGTPFYGEYFIARVLVKAALPESRFSVVVSKKVAKTAVVRNRNKRKVRALVAKLYPSLEKKAAVLVFVKKDISRIASNVLSADLGGVLKKAKLL
jgi:ribonuclease P protein component